MTPYAERYRQVGLFDSVTDAVGSAARKVGDAVSNPARTVRDIADKVERAPDAISRGARDAIKGARQLAAPVIKKGEAVARSAKVAAEQGVKSLGKGAAAVGKWAWDNKADIGFWAGTTALMLAVPVSGGASGALAGGLMAARGAAIAARVAQAGRAGATAVRAARLGAAAVRGAKGAVEATRAGQAVVRGGGAIRSARVALGGTKVGKAMIKAQGPVNAVAMTAGGANFADVANKYRKGKAGTKELALATLGVAPTGVLGFKSLAARRAARVNAKAADVAARRLDDVAASAAGAREEVARVASVAPRAVHPTTARAATEATEQAAGTAGKAAELRQRAVITRANPRQAEEAISAQTLADELDDVAVRAQSAKLRAEQAEIAAPSELTPAARAAKERLERAEAVATRARSEVRGLATKQARAETVEDAAEKVQTTLGTTAMHANLANNALIASRERSSSGWSLTDTTIARTLVTIMLGHNAKPATTGAR